MWLFRETDGSTLATFRILFGVVMAFDALFHWFYSDQFFPAGEFRPIALDFAPLRQLPVLPAEPVLLVSAVGAACVACGYLTRLGAVLFAACHAYLYLWDPTQFNNHNYLIVLLSLWIAGLGLNSQWSLDVATGRASSSAVVPWWQLGIFLFHIGLVYTFGAIQKLNPDWLQGEPLSIWLGVEAHRPFIGPYLAAPAAKYIFAYGGLLFDLLITPALCWKRTRPFAISATVLFHYTNSWLFQIGPFPWVMMATNVLFLEPSTPRRWWEWIRARWLGRQTAPKQSASSSEVVATFRPNSRVVWGCVIYVLAQVLVPFRSYLQNGNPEWTEEGKNYSWRMMLSHKDTFLGVQVIDLATGRVWEVDVREHLSPRQRRGKGVWGNPRVMVQYARFLRSVAIARGFRDPYVRVDAIASLNGRPHQYLVDPNIDLSVAELPWLATPTWVVPLESDVPIGNYDYVDPEVKFERVARLIQWQRNLLHEQTANPNRRPPTL